jgi:hypothetical protein
MMAWAWLGWITITVILFASIGFAWRNDWDWRKEAHRAWEIKAVTTSNFAFDNPNGQQQTGEDSVAKDEMNRPRDEESDFRLSDYDVARWKKAVSWLGEEPPRDDYEKAGPSNSAR